MTHTPHHRPGLTLLQALLLLLAVLALAGLGVMWIRQSWERSHRVQCMNNLKSLGEATLRYHELKKELPPSRIAPAYATWAALLLPFAVKDLAPEKRWDYALPYGQQSEAARQAQLAMLYCPARRVPPQLSTAGDAAPPDGAQFAGALGDYACVSGDDNPAAPWTSEQANGAIVPAQVLARDGARIVRWQAQTSLTGGVGRLGLPRGLSYTLLLGEKHVPWQQFGTTATGDGCIYHGSAPASYARTGGPGHPLAPGVDAPLLDQFGSAHLGVSQFLYADLHVEPIAVTIDPVVLARLLRRQE